MALRLALYMFKTIHLTIDDTLLAEVDSTSAELGMSRSAFIRQALWQAVERLRVARLERQHAEGYARFPVEPGEFDIGIWRGDLQWDLSA